MSYVKSHYNNFIPRDNFSDYDLRIHHNLTVPQHKLSIVANGSFVMSVMLYNKLPVTIKNINNIHQFKSTVRATLIEHSFYSIDEYMDCTCFQECV